MLAQVDTCMTKLPLFAGRLLTAEEQEEFRQEGREEGREETESEIFKNIMIPIIEKNKNINEGIKICKLALPHWDKEKISTALTKLSGDFNIKLPKEIEFSR